MSGEGPWAVDGLPGGGDCVVTDMTRIDEEGHAVRYLRVHRADPFVRMTTELLRRIIDRNDLTWGGMVAFSEGVLRFGTEGEGLGVVTYEIDDPQFMPWYRGDLYVPWINLRRVDEPENVKSA